MGFKAAEAVEALEYDFEPYSKAKGVIKEPTADQITAFRNALVSAYTDLGLDPAALNAATGGGSDMSAVLTHFGDIMASTDQMEERVLVAVADLTGGAPSEEEIRSMPYRPRQAFLGWMTGTFFNPEA
jgi:hypothetical protein